MNDFETFYKSLTLKEKQALRDTIVKLSGKRESTVRMWFSIAREVPKYEQTLIAELLKKPVTELFPVKKKKKFVPTKW